MTIQILSTSFLNLLIFFRFFLIVIATPDALPIQVEGNVYKIQEKNAIIYKKLPESKWRYSTYDQKGVITETYIMNGFLNLGESFYFLEQDNFINFYTKGQANYQIVDISKLVSQQSDYLQVQPVITKAQCSQVNMVRKYQSYYVYICSNPKIVFYEQSIAQLQASTTSKTYSQLDMTQDYVMLYPSLLIYKGNTFTQFTSITESIFKLIDIRYDFFLLNYSKFCRANLNVQAQTFSCQYSYYVGANQNNLILSPVFESNRKQLIFTRILDSSNSLFNYYQVFDVSNLSIVPRNFANFNDDTNSKSLIGYENVIFPSNGVKWNFSYDPSNKIQGIESSFTQPDSYFFVNEPFYNLNFQQGFTIFVNKDNSANYILDFRDAMILNCPAGQHLRIDLQCGTCPSYSTLDSDKNKCYCDSNSYYRVTTNTCICYYGFSPSADNTQCFCQNGYYINAGQCLQCNSGCHNCFGPQADNCLDCQSGLYLLPNKSCKPCNGTGQSIVGSECHCQSNYYPNNGACSICDPSCATCNGSSPNDCLTCPSGKYLYPNKSCGPCNTPDYVQVGLNCQPCSSNCQTCNGVNANNCILCKGGFYLFQDNTCNNCDTNNGYFISGINCLQCNSECKTCQNQSTHCLSCYTGKYIFADNQCRICDTNNRYFISGINCIQCDISCQTCSGTSQTQCLSCPAGKYLFTDNSCNDCDTLNKYYISGQNCISCNPLCSNCSGPSPTECLSCPSGKYLHEDKSCKSCDTSNGFFIQDINCIKCNPLCQTCSGPLSTNCLTCPSGKHLFSDKSCQECITSNGYFISGINCIKCNSSCKTCSGPSPTDCLSCPLGKYLFADNSCSDCNTMNGYFISGQNCIQCYSSCQSCKGPQSTDCLSCITDNYLFIDNSCSFCNTDNGYYISGKNCFSCHQSCKTCNGPSTTNCLTCSQQDYLFQDFSCHSPCETDKGYFIRNTNCLLCDETCETCYGEKKNQCLSCFQNSKIFKNKCEQQYYTYNSKTKQYEKEFETSQTISFTATVVSSALLNVISSSSFSIIANGFNSQKASFLILVDIKLPIQIYNVLVSFKSQFPSKQFQFFNFFESLIEQGEEQYENEKYELVNLSFNMLQSCGHSFVIFSICILVYLLFYFLLEKLKDTNFFKQKSKLIYENLISNTIVQYFQLTITMFIVGINQQIKSFFLQDEFIGNISLKAFLIIFVMAIIAYLFYQQIIILNKFMKKDTVQNFNEINREKILNGAIFDCKIRRNLMLIYFLFEYFLFPTLMIQLSSNWIGVSIASLVITAIELIMITYYRPYSSFLTNLYSTVNNFLWLGLYIQYYLINFYTQKSDVLNYEKSLDAICNTFLITLFVLIVIQPVYILLALILEIIKAIQAKRKAKQEQLESDVYYIKESTKIELVHKSVIKFKYRKKRM